MINYYKLRQNKLESEKNNLIKMVEIELEDKEKTKQKILDKNEINLILFLFLL
jgi:hypothetical protein